MKLSNETKNMRRRFFRVTRRKLAGVFGPGFNLVNEVMHDLIPQGPSHLDQALDAADEGGNFQDYRN